MPYTQTCKHEHICTREVIYKHITHIYPLTLPHTVQDEHVSLALLVAELWTSKVEQNISENTGNFLMFLLKYLQYTPFCPVYNCFT